ncbi:histidine kinase [Streptomyces sp. CA-278952]|uniref:sensor histidine kinase n=1 Tax=unclassified Streptomyces TaxID=2593676 RepID=UPI0022428A9F|nr:MULTISPECIES: histidine kinase [unclassified Streptomyces]UZI32667.1 histidine kinase [Streptomyces sp. VB1]WDG32598.1 histidine kinase [Streptomyces sp. CA-278952]
MSALLLLGVAWAAGTTVRERREGVRREVVAAAERAKIEERLRIARDIHDVVSHSVGLIAVKASIANHVLSTRPDEAKKALAAIEEVSRGALRDLRSTLTVLREDDAHGRTGDDSLRPARGLADVPDLVRSAEEAGVRVVLDSRCTGAVTEGVALSVFRIVQEALANVVRHAAPTRCRMTLVTEDGVLRVEIVDEGPLPSGAAPAVGRGAGPASGAGMGLVGMAERVAAHGGTLHTGPTVHGGFEVRATLPC